jgi:hypothetical protein
VFLRVFQDSQEANRIPQTTHGCRCACDLEGASCGCCQVRHAYEFADACRIEVRHRGEIQQNVPLTVQQSP